MENLIGSILGLFVGGTGSTLSGVSILPLIMSLIIWHLLQERKKLISENEKQDERIDKIIEDYHRGNLTLTEALNSLKLVLYEIKGTLK